MTTPIISIVIPTYQRPELLAVCLQSIVVQKLREKIEVIVVDNDPTASAGRVVERFHRESLIYSRESKVGHSFAKNKGLSQAKGEYCLFLDDDAKLPPTWSSNAFSIIHNLKSPIFLGGPIKPYYQHIPPDWYRREYEVRTFGNKAKVLTNNEFLPTSSTLIQTQALKITKGFDVSEGIKGNVRRFGEDTQVVRKIRASIKDAVLYYDPRLAVEHFTPASKTTLKHIITHHYNLGASGEAVSGDRVSRPKAIIKAGMSVMAIVWGVCVAYFLRDTKQYPYPQNYIWEKVAPHFYWLGRCR